MSSDGSSESMVGRVRDGVPQRVLNVLPAVAFPVLIVGREGGPDESVDPPRQG